MPCKCEFTQSDILRIFPNMKRGTLMSWSKRNLVRATYQEAVGHQGTFRKYSMDDVVKIGAMFALKQLGIKEKYIDKILNGELIEDE